jgi:hypothetical protein
LLPVIFTIAASLLLFYAPYFLVYRDKPVKSDVVVLFCSGDNKTRAMEAEKLLHEGYARYLIVPALGEMYQIMANGKMQRVTPNLKIGDLLFRLRKRAYYKEHFEGTHIEALEAKRMMDERGFSSALLVSSPYHTRRIRLIAGKVFGDDKYRFHCIPTSFESPFSAATWFDKRCNAILVNEYIKLGWFMMYRMFS